MQAAPRGLQKVKLMTRTTLLATALVALLSAAGASAQTAPNIGYNPAAGTAGAPGLINFGAGPAGNIQTNVVLTPSGGSGSGAAATTSVNCAFRDPQVSPARLSFCTAGTATTLTFEGATATSQNLTVCCERPTTGSLSNQVQCLETRGAAAPVQRVWDVSCGAPAEVPPQIASNPAIGTNINVCPSRTASITVTNTGDAGASALSVTNCAVSPASSQFSVSPTSLSVPLGAVSGNVLNIVLPAGAPVPVNATLSCNTNASNVASGTVSWTLVADTSCNTTPPPPPPTAPGPIAPVPAGGQLGYLSLLALLLGTGIAVVTLRKR